MSFTRVVYTADWNDRDRFPTYQPDENLVRADLQELPNQIKTQTNRLMTELEAGTAAASIGTRDGKLQDDLDSKLTISEDKLVIGGVDVTDQVKAILGIS